MDGDEAPSEAYVTGFYGFHFLTRQNNTRFDGFERFIVEQRALVFGEGIHNVPLTSLLLYHGAAFWQSFVLFFFVPLE